jgi:hypothetical protein
MKVRKGDMVLVIAGKDKGAKGKVIQAYPDTGRVLVEGVNRIKKHTRISRTQRGAKRWDCHPRGRHRHLERHGCRLQWQAGQGGLPH